MKITILGQQGWLLPPMPPGLESHRPHHIWVELVAGSFLCSICLGVRKERFAGCFGFSTPQKPCIVPRNHYCARPMRFGSRGPSESRPFSFDTSPKCIDREGLRRPRTGTRQSKTTNSKFQFDQEPTNTNFVVINCRFSRTPVTMRMCEV